MLRDIRDNLLVVNLAHGVRPRAAAEAAGCSLSTVKRRLRDTAFRGQLEAAAREVAERITQELEGRPFFPIFHGFFPSFLLVGRAGGGLGTSSGS